MPGPSPATQPPTPGQPQVPGIPSPKSPPLSPVNADPVQPGQRVEVPGRSPGNRANVPQPIPPGAAPGWRARCPAVAGSGRSPRATGKPAGRQEPTSFAQTHLAPRRPGSRRSPPDRAPRRFVRANSRASLSPRGAPRANSSIRRPAGWRESVSRRRGGRFLAFKTRRGRPRKVSASESNFLRSRPLIAQPSKPGGGTRKSRDASNALPEKRGYAKIGLTTCPCTSVSR